MRRRLGCLLLVLVVLALLLLALDRGAVAVVERVAQDRAGSYGVEGADVEVRGFPVLQQLVRLEAEDVDLRADALERGGVRVQDVVGTADGVRVATLSSVEVARLRVRGTVPFAELEERAGLEAGSVAAAGPDAVRVSQVVELLGRPVEAVVTARVALDGGELVVTPSALQVDGRDAPDLLEVVRERVTARVPLPALPAGVEVRSVAVGPGGVDVRADGTDVLLER
ncbi:LmeA family phospholipid-binding protein [Vallicoccus soli]|uniref:DUF2993 domain-containing protein n=1 Tax=Vallicoccus soli TaxID=2339232 RepID=A0A3A3Z4L1_9ACTN|nr:DUF2993 domain-containing protein [Vallicoccus soli]RJK98344.1 DUF2993 domain-containing protein [Vallicoccus soli]